MMALVALIGLLALQAASVSVSGQVIDAATRLPIAGAQVILARSDGPLLASPVAATNDAGRFVFAGVRAGTYQAIVVHQSYVKQVAGQPIIIANGAGPAPLDVPLVPTAVISGQVLDEFGDPARRIHVRAWQGQRMVAERRTDDLGTYRLFGLAPGAYAISAERYAPPRIEGDRVVTPTPPCPDCRGEGTGMMLLATSTAVGGFIDPRALTPNERSPTVYYPRTTVAAEAEPIDAPAGAHIANVDLRLVTVPVP